jgi:hypothetical protein
MEELDNIEIEELAKGPNYWKDKDPAKYKKMLAKLARERKTPGHKERATQQALQAKRRERGGKGTTTGGHAKNHGDFKKLKNQVQNAEKKTGEKLSLDRKKNGEGYGSGNTRTVPQKLNRGRHHVDPKKLKNWKKKLKKSGLELDDFMTLLRAKALQNNQEELAKALAIMDLNRALEYMGFYDEVDEDDEELAKSNFLPPE